MMESTLIRVSFSCSSLSLCRNGQVPGRQWTVSIAVPGSVIDNTQNAEFATFVAGQIARAAAIFNVDEVCPKIFAGR